MLEARLIFYHINKIRTNAPRHNLYFHFALFFTNVDKTKTDFPDTEIIVERF